MNLRNKPRIGQELLDVPMGSMIQQMAMAIAEGQMALDANSIDVAEMMGGLKTITDDDGNVTFEDSRVFFGNETITISEAVDRLNSGTDSSSAASIKLKGGADIEGSGPYTVKAASDDKTITIPQRLSMMELGFTPTFYQFVDSIIEVKIAIKYTQEGSSTVDINRSTTNKSSRGVGGGVAKFFGSPNASKSTVSTSQVNASYSQKYSYSAEGSSLLRTKLVPIPPPAVLEERIRKMMDEEFTETPS
ncbi:hypothetical protein [uncultured Olleya sp.]|uniref:hypothetical protein n=1 Tax=uncultured Olleya sp. TaxID=757243 RepID=UPI002598AD09|nr:hypothetical protein [uncultured Olleya sp.]